MSWDRGLRGFFEGGGRGGGGLEVALLVLRVEPTDRAQIKLFDHWITGNCSADDTMNPYGGTSTLATVSLSSLCTDRELCM